MDYDILFSVTRSGLVTWVKEEIKKGWKPQGGMSTDKRNYYQAMTKEKPVVWSNRKGVQILPEKEAKEWEDMHTLERELKHDRPSLNVKVNTPEKKALAIKFLLERKAHVDKELKYND